MKKAGHPVYVIGCGPSGMMAALAAAAGGADVKIMDAHDPPGAKLLASGGGRCNITNTADPEDFMNRFGRNGRFMSHALDTLGAVDLRRRLRSMGVETVVDADGRVFPASQKSETVHSALLGAVRRAGAMLHHGMPLESVFASKGAVSGFRAGGRNIPATCVIVATGGCSYPSLGSDGIGYRIASDLGIALNRPLPALVPLTSPDATVRSLAGVSLRGASVRVRSEDRTHAEVTGDIMFTHCGVSGPAILDTSGTAAQLLDRGSRVNLLISVAPDTTASSWEERFDELRLSSGRRKLLSVLDQSLPASFALALTQVAGIPPQQTVSQCKRESLRRIASLLSAFPVPVDGTAGFDKAMVTRGGISLEEIDSRTMESRRVSGLYFAGEVVDLDGPTGGFNLQWAFSSGWLAGKSAARHIPH